MSIGPKRGKGGAAFERALARELSRCADRFKTGEAVGDVRCKRTQEHRGPHIADAPWGMVHWTEKRPLVLTKAQRDLLESANESIPPNERAVRFDWSGVGVRGARLRTAAALSKLGLIEYVDHGRCEDDDNGDAEVPIYAITDGMSPEDELADLFPGSGAVTDALTTWRNGGPMPAVRRDEVPKKKRKAA